jgi:hypothetical protein
MINPTGVNTPKNKTAMITGLAILKSCDDIQRQAEPAA